MCHRCAVCFHSHWLWSLLKILWKPIPRRIQIPPWNRLQGFQSLRWEGVILNSQDTFLEQILEKSFKTARNKIYGAFFIANHGVELLKSTPPPKKKKQAVLFGLWIPIVLSRPRRDLTLTWLFLSTSFHCRLLTNPSDRLRASLRCLFWLRVFSQYWVQISRGVRVPFFFFWGGGMQK